MTEPGNHTVVRDCNLNTWVRFDEWPGPHGTWRPITTSPNWHPDFRDQVGPGHAWPAVLEQAPLIEAEPDVTVWALALVRGAQS